MNTSFCLCYTPTNCLNFENFITFFENVWSQNYSEVGFDCITIHNTVHGIGRNDTEVLVNLLNTIQKLTKYIIISEPNWDIWNKEEQLEIKEKINWNNWNKIHTFPKTYKHQISYKTYTHVKHHLYEVDKCI